jgi:hypothetical protein
MSTLTRLEIVEDHGGPLVRVRDMDDGSEFSVPRRKLRRYDGCFVLRSERDHQIREAVKKRQEAKAPKKFVTVNQESEPVECSTR